MLGNCTERQSSQKTSNCKEKQRANNTCALPYYLSVPAFACITIPQAWFELKAQHKTLASLRLPAPSSLSLGASPSSGARPYFIKNMREFCLLFGEMGITYRWPWGPLWHGRCRTGWQGRFRSLWPQTGQSAHMRRTQTQLPESESTAVKVKIRNRICESHHCQLWTADNSQILYTVPGVLTLSGWHHLPGLKPVETPHP